MFKPMLAVFVLALVAAPLPGYAQDSTYSVTAKTDKGERFCILFTLDRAANVGSKNTPKSVQFKGGFTASIQQFTQAWVTLESVKNQQQQSELRIVQASILKPPPSAVPFPVKFYVRVVAAYAGVPQRVDFSYRGSMKDPQIDLRGQTVQRGVSC